ncbi:MAG: adenylyltransferase/cytidyltransferase family protein [Actinomycetota bacterium]|nr:adenylyltransferase/cytidyltransferase family protein [Actinomycetota bacterium]
MGAANNMGVVLGHKELKARLDADRSAGKKIVFTNGCFDIIHAGHVRYLREARKFGGVLVLALNTDASVSRLKPGRPVNKEAERAEVAAALEVVDYVTMFDEDTPYELIKFLGPDVLVKGGDWKKEDIVGSDLVPETHSLSFHRGFSTTGIIEKIEKKKS